MSSRLFSRSHTRLNPDSKRPTVLGFVSANSPAANPDSYTADTAVISVINELFPVIGLRDSKPISLAAFVYQVLLIRITGPPTQPERRCHPPGKLPDSSRAFQGASRQTGCRVVFGGPPTGPTQDNGGATMARRQQLNDQQRRLLKISRPNAPGQREQPSLRHGAPARTG